MDGRLHGHKLSVLAASHPAQCGCISTTTLPVSLHCCWCYGFLTLLAAPFWCSFPNTSSSYLPATATPFAPGFLPADAEAGKLGKLLNLLPPPSPGMLGKLLNLLLLSLPAAAAAATAGCCAGMPGKLPNDEGAACASAATASLAASRCRGAAPAHNSNGCCTHACVISRKCIGQKLQLRCICFKKGFCSEGVWQQQAGHQDQSQCSLTVRVLNPIWHAPTWAPVRFQPLNVGYIPAFPF